MTPITCPCCRAANDAGPACRRCKADLTLLFAVEQRREYLVNEARRAAAAGEWAAALRALDEARSLRAGDDLRRVRAVVALLRRDFHSAWELHTA